MGVGIDPPGNAGVAGEIDGLGQPEWRNVAATLWSCRFDDDNGNSESPWAVHNLPEC